MNNEIKEILGKDFEDVFRKEFVDIILELPFSNLLDYITNLQQENQELNDSKQWWNNRFNAVQRDYEELQQENERLKTKTKEQSLLLIDYQDMEQKLENYKSRIELKEKK